MTARLLALVVGLALVCLTAVPLAGRLLVVADPLPPSADAIVVLAGSIPTRVLEAADLYRAGLAPRVVVTREHLPRGTTALRARGVHIPESDELTTAALEQLGVPEQAIVRLRRRGRSTESEARTVARYACSHHLRRLVIVTSRPHTRRARLIYRRALGDTIALALRPSRYDVFSTTRWWHVRRDAKTVLYEYERLIHHWLRERWTIKPCGGLRRRAAGPPLNARASGGGGAAEPTSAASARACSCGGTSHFRGAREARTGRRSGAPAAARRHDQAASTAARISGASSPRACISRTMSHPPTNLPLT